MTKIKKRDVDMTDADDQNGKLDMFLQWLEQDPNNTSLLVDAVSQAIDTSAFDTAHMLLDKFSSQQGLTPELSNLAGMLAIREQNFESAIEIFGKLIDQGYESAATRFNLAWSFAVTDQKEQALLMIDDELARQLPQAAALKIQMLHSEGQFEQAMDEAMELIDHHPEDPGLMAAVSVLAIDVENVSLAKACAEKAREHPDALTTLGTLELSDNQLDIAQQRFEKALEMNENNPRAWVGQGLVHLSNGNKNAALSDLDRGAKLFDTHIGSWIAAGWAHFLNGDYTTSRERFQTALDLDGSFAESQGSLAVLDVIDGEMKDAQKRCETALRLDRKCLTAALAKSMILRSQGDTAMAQKVVELAMHTPIDENGRTLADSLVKMNSQIVNPISNETFH